MISHLWRLDFFSFTPSGYHPMVLIFAPLGLHLSKV